MMTALSQHSGVTQLEFHQAMNDFKTMFPEVDEDVIEVVLRSNNGAVDATIDQLLAMNIDSENERIRTQLDARDRTEVPPRYSAATPPPSYQQAVPGVESPKRNPISKPNESNRRTSTPSDTPLMAAAAAAIPSKDSLRYKRKWNPPLIGHLPAAFLRIEADENQRKLASTYRRQSDMTALNSTIIQQKMEENQRQRQLSITSDDPELAQFLEDERIALFLQNEEFVRELRRNKDFMSTLELDTAGTNINSGSFSSSAEGPTAGSAHSDSDAAFKETLKHMGKISRRKFAQLARLFSGRKRRNFQPLLGSDGNNPSRDNLLSREDEYTQFQNEGSDNDETKENASDFRTLSEGEWNASDDHRGNVSYFGNTLKTSHRN